MNQTEFDRVKSLPFHHFLGIKDIYAKEGKSHLEITVTENIRNPAGSFHGGVLYTVCEITAYSALLSTLGEGEIGVTNHISVQVMRAAQLGESVSFEAEILKPGRRVTFLECTARVAGKIIAKANISKTMVSLKK